MKTASERYVKRAYRGLKAIPRRLWITRAFQRDGKCCAVGHLRYTLRISEENILQIRSAVSSSCGSPLVSINDNHAYVQGFRQKTTKGRVLAALRKTIASFK